MTIVRFFATGVAVDDLLTADSASPVSDDMPPSVVPSGEKGFHGSRMAEFGERPGVNIGHIHHYFESKEAKK
jgi:hypothetical protein